MKRTLIFLIPIFIFLGCERESNDVIITEIKKRLTNSKDEFENALGKIAVLNCYDTCFFWHFSKMNKLGYSHSKDNAKLESMPKSTIDFLNFFMMKNNCSITAYRPEFIMFNFSLLRNKNGDDISLINHLGNPVNLKDRYSGFDIYLGQSFPKKHGGWIYIIDNNWIIYSPQKKQLNLIDRISLIIGIISIVLSILIIMHRIVRFLFSR